MKPTRSFVFIAGIAGLGVLFAVWQSTGAGAQKSPPFASQNGDVNGDGSLDISDAVYLLVYLFQGGPEPVACAAPEPGLTDEQRAVLSRFSLDSEGNLVVRGKVVAEELAAANLHQVAYSGDYRDLENRPDAEPTPGVHFAKWVVTRACLPGESPLKQLFDAFAGGDRKTNETDTGSLIYLDRDGNPARRIDFFGYTPLHYESINVDSRNPGQAATEVLEFDVLRCSYARGDAGPPDAPIAGFAFMIEGKVVDGILSVLPGAFQVVADAEGRAAGGTGAGLAVPAEPVCNISKFRLDLIAGGGEGGAANWYAIRHADAQMITESGDVEWSEVRVVGPFVSGGTRRELLEILNDWAEPSGPRSRFNASLELLDARGSPVRTLNFHDCIPVEYHPPAVRAGDDALLEETFIFKPARVEDVIG